MRGFVLAAGFGTRLRPLTEHVPKALVPVCGEPLLKRSLDLLNKNGITVNAANAHYLAEQIFEFRSASGYEFEIFHEEGEIRGTGGAFPFAKSFLDKDDSFCVVNADIITNANLKKMSEEFLDSDSICMLVAAPAKGKGSILMDEDSFDYRGIVGNENTTGKAVDFIGISFYKKEFLDKIGEEDFSIVPVWKRLQDEGHRVTIKLDCDLYWQDTGTPAQFAKAHFDMLQKNITLEMPPHMNLVDSLPIAIADTYEESIINKVDGSCWIGNSDLDDVISISKSIILDNAMIDDRKNINNSILTPWGDIEIDA